MINVSSAKSAYQSGKLLAYPTEAVWGLGCDPFNTDSIQSLLDLKGRDANKGFIVVAATVEQLQPFVQKIPEEQLAVALKTWPGAVTWLFPKNPTLPEILTGDSAQIAVRVSAHPIVQALCLQCGPLVSTSANRSGEKPARAAEEVRAQFPDADLCIVEGAIGGLVRPTPIYDVMTGRVIRA